MKVQTLPPQRPRPLQPQPPGPPPPTEGVKDVIDHVGAVQLGGVLSDIGMAGAYTFAPSGVMSGMGFGLAAFHAARGAAFGALALKEKDRAKLQQRIGVAASEGMLAAGHVLGALGHGPLSLPLLAGGALLNGVADYRYRKHFGVDSPQNGRVSAGQKIVTGADAALSLGYATGLVPGAVGVAAGLGHLGAMAGYYGMSIKHPEMKHHWHSKGFGHALLAAGNLAGAAGAGVWALPALAGGMLITTLQDYRQNG